MATKEFDANSKAHHALLQALYDGDIARIIHCKPANEIRSHLVITHERTSEVKRGKIDLFNSQYENFVMNEEESIDDMIIKITKITNGFTSLGDR